MSPTLTPADPLVGLENVLDPDAVFTEDCDRESYERGWRYGAGRALAVVKPREPEEVARVLAWAHAHGVRVQPIGANTGLVGASNPDETGEQLVLSLERLARMIDVDPVGRIATVDAGVTLSQLNEALEPHGLFFPVDLGADPQIGGMIATDTGGTRLLRYGSVRRNLLGVQVALADGRLWNGLSQLEKDNRGLDLKQVFTGTSGSFGIVTRAVLKLAPLPRQRSTAWVALADGEAALRLLAHLERQAGETLSAYEVLSQEALEVTLAHGADVKSPFPDGLPSHAALIELATTLAPELFDLDEVLMQALEGFLEHDEGLLEATPLRPAAAWHLRHQVSESLRHEGRVLALDVSVPRSQIARFSAAVRAAVGALGASVRVCDFGHWGDGGTHLNLVWNEASVEDSDALASALQTRIVECCVEDFGGSFSAEHGVGPHNQRYYDRYASPLLTEVSQSLKELLDPERSLGNVRWEGCRSADAAD